MSTVRIGDETHEFAFANPSNVEVMAIERVTDSTFKEWGEKVQAGSITALTALVWVLRRRSDPSLGFDDVQFNIADFAIDDEDAAEPDPTDAIPSPVTGPSA